MTTPSKSTIIGRYQNDAQNNDFLQLENKDGGSIFGGIDGFGYRYGTLAAGDVQGVLLKTADYVVTSADNGQLISVNSSGTVNLTLPVIAPDFPWFIQVQATGSGSVIIHSTPTIDGSAGTITLTQNQGLQIVSNGSAYFTQRGIGGAGGTGFAGVSTQTNDYTALAGDTGKLITFSKSSAVTLTLPAVAPGSTWFIYVQNRGAGFLTINRNGLNIDGAVGNIGLLQNQGLMIFSDGSNYFTDRGVAGVGNVSAQSNDYTALPTDSGKLISMNKASAVQLTLPATSPGPYWFIMVQDIGAGTLTINRNGLNIDGAASNLTLTTAQGIIIYSDGTNYFTSRGSGTASNVSIKPAAAIGFQFVAASGNDTNDGLSWGTAKLTIMAGYDALPAAGGTVFIAGQGTDTTEWPAATSTSGQGIWLMGTNDPNYSSPPAGWRQAKNGQNVQVAFIGVPSTMFGANSVTPNMASFLGGNSTNPAIWLSGVSGTSFRNLYTQYPKSFAWLAVNSNGVKNDNAGGSNIVFENCGVNVNGGSSAFGPCIDVGPNLFWVRFTNVVLQCNSLADESSDNRCAILLKEDIAPNATITATSLTSNVATYIANNSFINGQLITVSGCTNSSVFNGTFNIVTATSTQFTISITHATNITSAPESATASSVEYNTAAGIVYIDNPHFTGGGGIRYYNQHIATGGHRISNCEAEGTGNSQPLYEVMTAQGVFSSNIWLSEGISDSGDNPPAIKIASGVPPWSVSAYVNTFFSYVGIEGPCTVISPYGQSSNAGGSVGGQASGRCSPVAKMQQGLMQGRLTGGTNAGRRLGIGQPRWLNRVSQLPSAWTPHGTASVTTGVTAPDLTTNAAKITVTSGQDYAVAGSMTRTFLPGDYVYAGVWVKAASTNGVGAGLDTAGFWAAGAADPSPDFRVVAGSQNARTTGSTNGNFYNTPFHQTDGDWQWIWTIVKCRVQKSAYEVDLNLRSVEISGTLYPMSYYAPVLMHIPLADLTNQTPLTISAAGVPGVSQSGNVVTVTTTTAHNLAQGQIIVVAGVTAGGYNGEFVVASVVSSTQFTYYNSTTGLSNSGSGTVSVCADSEAAEWALCNSSTADNLSAGPMVATLRGIPLAFGGSGDNFHAILDHTALTANRTLTVPDGSGSIVLTSAGNVFIPAQEFDGGVKIGASGTTLTQGVVYTPTLTPAPVAMNTSAEQDFSVSGVTTADTIYIAGPAPTAGTGIVNWRVKSNGVVSITFGNFTGGSLTPTSGVYRILAFRS